LNSNSIKVTYKYFFGCSRTSFGSVRWFVFWVFDPLILKAHNFLIFNLFFMIIIIRCVERRVSTFVGTLETMEPSPWIWPISSCQMFSHQLFYLTGAKVTCFKMEHPPKLAFHFLKQLINNRRKNMLNKVLSDYTTLILGQFNNNYIIFKNVEISKTYVFHIKKYCEEKYWIFKNIPCVEMKFSKLINYLTDICWNGQGIIVSKLGQVFACRLML
jgi:hypothetical protein